MALTNFRILLEFNMTCKSISYKMNFKNRVLSNTKLAVIKNKKTWKIFAIT